MRRSHAVEYLVMRTLGLFGYVEYFGPMVSCPSDSQRDAERLYGKAGYTVKVTPWRSASRFAKAMARESAP